VTKTRLSRDIPGAIAVFLVALPLCVGLARACNVPATSGLLAGVVGGILVGGLSGSPFSVTGPAAGLVPVVLLGMSRLGSFNAMLCATCIAGLIQLLLGFARAGSVARLFPVAVIRGMMAAIGVIMIYKQIPHLLGYDLETFGVDTFSPHIFLRGLPPLETVPCTLGVLSLLLMAFWEIKVHPKFPALPGSIIVAGFGILVQVALTLLAPEWALSDVHRVQISADWLTSHPSPDWSALANPQVYWIAVTLALVASLETLVALEVIDRLDPKHRVAPPNRELFAQGAGNLVCGILGGMPVTSVLARGSVNVAAGSSSKAATMIQGALLGVALLFLGPQLSQLPLASLAAVLIVVGTFLIQPRSVRELFQRGRTQSLPFLLTVLGILFGDLLVGILLGMALSFAYVVLDLFVSRGFVAERHGRSLQIKLASEVTFFHKAALIKVMQQAQPGDIVHIDGSDSRSISFDVLEAIQEFREGAPFREVQVVVGGIREIPSHSEEHMQELDNEYHTLISNNREWVEEKLKEDPTYFESMSQGQTPTFLFIGCSDSRVPAEAITKTDPGKLFVHRNIANIVSHSDVNLMSVLQYSVEVLKVPHIIVCGHYGCGGVHAALGRNSLGLIDQWIIPIKTTYKLHQEEILQIKDPKLRERRMVELHVIQQVRNLLKTSILQRSLKNFGRPKVHGWVYDLETGLINDLGVELNPKDDLLPIFRFEFDGPDESH